MSTPPLMPEAEYLVTNLLRLAGKDGIDWGSVEQKARLLGMEMAAWEWDIIETLDGVLRRNDNGQ